jgi:hypothetical protein
VYGQPIISRKDKEYIWRLMKGFVKISILYIHENRKPSLMVKEVEGQKKNIPVYLVKFKPEIKLEEHSPKWEVKLPFSRKILP